MLFAFKSVGWFLYNINNIQSKFISLILLYSNDATKTIKQDIQIYCNILTGFYTVQVFTERGFRKYFICNTWSLGYLTTSFMFVYRLIVHTKMLSFIKTKRPSFYRNNLKHLKNLWQGQSLLKIITGTCLGDNYRCRLKLFAL